MTISPLDGNVNGINVMFGYRNFSANRQGLLLNGTIVDCTASSVGSWHWQCCSAICYSLIGITDILITQTDDKHCIILGAVEYDVSSAIFSVHSVSG